MLCRTEDSDYDDDELSDSEIDKLVIFTQKTQLRSEATITVHVSPPNRPSKHEGYDRTGNWTTRTKITQALAQVINDGLRYYEDDLEECSSANNSFTTVNLITKEHFEKIAPPMPRANNPEVCPPPPPPVPFNTPACNATTTAMAAGKQASGSSSRTRGHHRSHKRSNQARFYPAPTSEETKESNVGWIIDKRSRRSRTASTR